MEYADLNAKWSDLSRQLAEVNKAIEANAALLYGSRENPARYKGGNDAGNGISERAAALLGDQPSNSASLKQEKTALEQEARDLQQAMGVLNERLATARLQASKAICQQIEPDVRALLSELARSMALTSHLAIQYRELTQKLNTAKIAWADMNPMGIRVGGVAEKGSHYTLWLNAAAQRGYIELDMLPKMARHLQAVWRASRQSTTRLRT